MERRCSWCGHYMGERCKRCGSERVQVFLSRAGERKLLRDMGIRLGQVAIVLRDILKCDDCGHSYERGADGVTHGMCALCQQTELTAHRQQLVN